MTNDMKRYESCAHRRRVAHAKCSAYKRRNAF